MFYVPRMVAGGLGPKGSALKSLFFRAGILRATAVSCGGSCVVVMGLQEFPPHVLPVDCVGASPRTPRTLVMVLQETSGCGEPLGTVSVGIGFTIVWAEYVSACPCDHPRATCIH